jgi:hypothetical protein|tara:strand:+ start:470 stop:667 length:198 start_codon:yes stop_codon:yes gene_type:complete
MHKLYKGIPPKSGTEQKFNKNSLPKANNQQRLKNIPQRYSKAQSYTPATSSEPGIPISVEKYIRR